jgi:hypothetical protein
MVLKKSLNKENKLLIKKNMYTNNTIYKYHEADHEKIKCYVNYTY